MPELRSQVYLSRTSITRLVQWISAIAGEVLKMYKVPLTQLEIADILAAYSECAQRITFKRKTIRLPKNCKNNDPNNAGNTVEIVYHEQAYGKQAEADAWPQHEYHNVSAAWESPRIDFTLTGNDTNYPELLGDQS